MGFYGFQLGHNSAVEFHRGKLFTLLDPHNNEPVRVAKVLAVYEKIVANTGRFIPKACNVFLTPLCNVGSVCGGSVESLRPGRSRMPFLQN